MIEKAILETLVKKELSTREIGAVVGHSQSSVKHWLQKHGLKTVFGPHGRWAVHTESRCRVCSKVLPDRRRQRCEACSTRVRRMRMKLAAIAMKGGACQRCGWTGLPAGFDFHHRDGATKEYRLGQFSNRSWVRIKVELEKCDLLCRTCHAIEHSKHDDEKLMAEVSAYPGIEPRKLI